MFLIIYTGPLDSADFKVAVFTQAHFQKIPKIFVFFIAGMPSLMLIFIYMGTLVTKLMTSLMQVWSIQ